MGTHLGNEPVVIINCDLLQNELEVALKLNGTSFVGLGWKPMQVLDTTCNSDIPVATTPGKKD